MNNIKYYRINRFAEVEGNNTLGWTVINMVTGLAQETTYATFLAASDAASFLNLYYEAME